MKIWQAAPNTLKTIEKVFKFTGSGARGSRGEKGDTGDAGGIDYANPIAVNASTTITPTDGQFFTTTSKLPTLTGTAGEVFEPAEAGETSRIIWGRGAVGAITVQIDTSSLGPGGIFAFGAENGESRVMRLNSVGDLVKIGGVEIPMEFSATLSADAGFSLLSWTKVLLDVAGINKGDVFDTANSYFQPSRNADWNLGCLYTVAGTGAVTRTTARLIIDPGVVLSDFFGDIYPDEDNTTGKAARSPGAPALKSLTTSDQVFLGVFADAASGTIVMVGGSNIGECRMSGIEVIPW